jgi:chitinase
MRLAVVPALAAALLLPATSVSAQTPIPQPNPACISESMSPGNPAVVAYRCLQSHTSLVGWEPPNVPALWQLVS